MTEHKLEHIGPHDLGGMDGDVVDRAEHDLAYWERQVDAMIFLLRDRGIMKEISQLRDGIERLGPNVYEELSYYERWAASAASIAMRAGVVTEQELEQRISALRKAAADKL